MDILSHGLWGGIAFGRRNTKAFWWSFGFGIAPDLFSFGVFTIMTFLGLAPKPAWEIGSHPGAGSIPDYIYQLYNVTHSFVPFAAVFALVWLFRKKPFLPMLAWPLHILLDIPTHTTEFFPTPFLWPLLNNIRANGIPWSHPYIFWPNWIALVVLYVWWIIKKRSARKKPIRSR